MIESCELRWCRGMEPNLDWIPGWRDGGSGCIPIQLPAGVGAGHPFDRRIVFPQDVAGVVGQPTGWDRNDPGGNRSVAPSDRTERDCETGTFRSHSLDLWKHSPAKEYSHPPGPRLIATAAVPRSFPESRFAAHHIPSFAPESHTANSAGVAVRRRSRVHRWPRPNRGSRSGTLAPRS